MKKIIFFSSLLVILLLVSFNLIFSGNNLHSFDKIGTIEKINEDNDDIEKKYLGNMKEVISNEVDDKVSDEENDAQYLIIDRFEGNLAVCENEEGKMIDIERAKLPEEAKEGYVLKFAGDRFEIDYDETEKRKNKTIEFLESLWEWED